MTMKNTLTETYTTKDFYLAAFLLANDFEILNLDKTDPRKVFFVFQDMENRENLVEDFLFGKAQVEPKKFTSAIKQIKQLLYND